MARKKKAPNTGEAKTREKWLREVRTIAQRFQSHLKGPVEDHATMLYDERGLPK